MTGRNALNQQRMWKKQKGGWEDGMKERNIEWKKERWGRIKGRIEQGKNKERQ